MIHFSTAPCVVTTAGGLLLSNNVGCWPALTWVMKNCVGWISLNWNVRVVDTEVLLAPPKRLWLLLKAVVVATTSSVPPSTPLLSDNTTLNMARVGSQSPWGPVLMLLVINCAT